jgi:hypothetical protein
MELSRTHPIALPACDLDEAIDTPALATRRMPPE